MPAGEGSAVAIHRTHTAAEDAVKLLQRGGVDMRHMSILGKGAYKDQVVGDYNAGERMKYWGKVGAFWGGFWGLLFDSAVFIIPGLGPVLLKRAGSVQSPPAVAIRRSNQKTKRPPTVGAQLLSDL